MEKKNGLPNDVILFLNEIDSIVTDPYESGYIGSFNVKSLDILRNKYGLCETENDPISGYISIPDIRNKLSPIKNLLALLKMANFKHSDERIDRLINEAIEQSGKSVEYLSQK